MVDEERDIKLETWETWFAVGIQQLLVQRLMLAFSGARSKEEGLYLIVFYCIWHIAELVRRTRDCI